MFIHTLKHLDNLTFHSKMKVHSDSSDGCMNDVTSKSGWDILQNSYWSFNSTVCLTTSVGYAHLDG